MKTLRGTLRGCSQRRVGRSHECMPRAVRRRGRRVSGGGWCEASLESRQRRFSHLLSVPSRRVDDDKSESADCWRRRRSVVALIRVFTHRGPSFFRAVTARGAITVVSHRGVDRHNESIRRGWCEVVGIVYMRYQPRVATRAPQVHNE